MFLVSSIFFIYFDDTWMVLEKAIQKYLIFLTFLQNPLEGVNNFISISFSIRIILESLWTCLLKK